MPNPFDQAARYAAKLDPAGFLCWALALPLSVSFTAWLDTRTLPFPGDPDRTCDTVACLRTADSTNRWAVVIEFSLDPDPSMFGRLLVYLGQLWLERRHDEYRVGAAVINLRGQGQTSHDMELAGTLVRTTLQVVERNLDEEDAAATLANVAAGRLAHCVLPWIALMRGGADPDILERWKELAGAEADSRKRADYGGLASVFADAANRFDSWKEALKEWNMIESKAVLEWMAEARAQDLLRLLEKKFQAAVPSDIRSPVERCADPQQLSRWFDTALDAESLDDFRKKLNDERNGA